MSLELFNMLTIIAQYISIFPIIRLKIHEYVPEEGILHDLVNKVKAVVGYQEKEWKQGDEAHRWDR